LSLRAPFACPGFTLRFPAAPGVPPRFVVSSQPPLSFPEVARPLDLKPRTWLRQGEFVTVCFDLPKGKSQWLRTAT
jgi:hypothetical protein